MIYPHDKMVLSRWISAPLSKEAGGKRDQRVQVMPHRAALDDLGPLADGSVLLGLSSETLPVSFQLTDPTPGAFLIFGDPQTGKTDLLLSILESAAALNPGRVSLALISNGQYSAPRFGVPPERLDTCRPYQPEAARLVEKLVRLAQRRLEGFTCEPAVLLGIDDLDVFLVSLPERARNAFFWLVQNGAAARIWTLAALTNQAGVAELLAGDLRTAFPTLVLGHLEDKPLAARLTGGESLPCALLTGTEFCLSARRDGLVRRAAARSAAAHSAGIALLPRRKWTRFSIFRTEPA